MPPRGPKWPRRRPGGKSDAAVASPDTTSAYPDSLPEVFVEWLPNDTPSAEDGVWVDITQYVANGSTSRGRQVEFDQFAAGRMTLTLKSPSRLFDPENTSGTYFGKLLPMKQVRVRAKWQGVYYPIWRGYVVSWGETVVQNTLFVTTVNCADAFYRLEQIKLAASPYAMEVLKDRPAAWFRFNEPTGVYCPDSSGNGTLALYQNCTQGATGLVSGDSDRAATFAYSTTQRVSVNNPSLITAYPFAFTCMFQIGDGHSIAIICSAFSKTNSSAVGSFNIYMGPSGVITFIVWDTSSVIRRLDTVGAYDDNIAHHLAVVATDAGNFAIYVDGIADYGVTTAGAPTFPPAPFVGYGIGNYVFSTGPGIGAAGFGGTQPGTIDEPAFWTQALTSTRVAAHALAGKNGWANDNTATRVTRFLDLIGWPTGLRDISTGISTLGAVSWSNGSSALSVLQGWADTELGAFFASKDGKLVWRSRHYPILNERARRAQATFGDTDSSAPIYIQVDTLDFPRRAELIRNPVYASRDGGITAKARDDYYADIVYGDRAWAAPSAQEATDTPMFDRAFWLLAHFKTEKARVDQMTIPVRAQPQNWPAILNVELGDRINIQFTPLGQNNQINVDQILEGIEWTFDPVNLVPTFRAAPVDPSLGNYLILDDATFGLLDTGILAY